MIGLALLAPLSSFAEENGANKKKPNIIYILADDLGISELGCYGQQLIETPNIDRLSQEGMTFSNHYSGTAVSAPSRCVLFTGLHTGHAYIRGNDEMASRGDVWNHKAVLADSTLEGQRPVSENGDWGIPVLPVPQTKWDLTFSTDIIAKEKLIPTTLHFYIETNIGNI